MATPTPDQVQVANEVLAGTREITGTAAPKEEQEMKLDDAAKQQAMDIATPEFRAQVHAVETAGTGTAVNPTEPVVGVERSSIDKLPDPYDAKAVEAFQQEKRADIRGPGE